MNWPMLFKMFCVVLFAFGAGFWCAYTVYFQKPKAEDAKVREVIDDAADRVASGIARDWSRDAAADPAFFTPDRRPSDPQRGVTRSMRQPAVFTSPDGGVYPPMHKWGDLPYEEIAPMFLDQFLLRYFSKTFYVAIYPSLGSDSSWGSFCAHNADAKDLPILFQQLTGYELTDRQLNWAIDEYMSRLQRAHAGKNQPVETAEKSGNIKA